VISFKKFLKEMNTAGEGGVFGSYAGPDSLVGNQDTYNPGSAIIPYGLGTYTRAGKVKKRRKRRKKK